MRFYRWFSYLFIVIIALLSLAASDPPPAVAGPEVEAELSAAFQRRLETQAAQQVLTFDLFTPEIDTAFLAPDGQTAVIWLALRDDSGRILGTEPGLALATLSEAGWQVLLPGDAGWDETIAGLSQGMLPAEQAPAPEGQTNSLDAGLQALTGYYLPWAKGISHWLEGSISHYSSVPEYGYPSCDKQYCEFAYDFTDYGHFPLLASKDGTVFASRDSCSNSDTSCTNYIVLQTSSDNAYQLYLHLAQGTIPDKLTAGRVVQRGEYIGDTDDTGYSTSEHVHFMVVNSIWLSPNADKYYWGYSIDVRFADVPINNGMPRNCLEIVRFGVVNGASQCTGSLSDWGNLPLNLYTSGNTGQYPPSGSISRPEAGKVVAAGANPLMDATATATDDVSIRALRYVVKINNTWVEIGPKVTDQYLINANTYDWDINLCEAGPLNGNLEVGLRIWDWEGNVAWPLDVRTIYVDAACPGQVYLPLIRR